MSNIERNFVQDNGTVKENISYNPKYVINDDTSNYRRIGDIPVSGNYEPNMPYPLDARTLVPKVEYLTDTNWWRTAFGVDTVLYKGMLVTCVENHMIYIYDGETIKITNGLPADRIDHWKKQRIDKSLTKWPIDEDENEKIRIGADVISYKNFNGLYITNSSTLKGASFYIADNFISLGANEVENAIYPFIPYDIEDNNDETLANFTGKQTGIFIPTTTNDEILDTAIPITIYSSRGVNIENIIPDNNVDAKTLNQIKLDAYGSLTNYASANLNLNAGADISINTDASLHLNVFNNLEANIGNNIAINANTADIKFSGNYSKETSAYLLNSSTFTLITDSASDINVSTNQVYVKYASGVKIFGNSDNKSIIDVQQTNIEAKSKNVNIDASVIKLSINNKLTNNNRIFLNDTSLKVFANKTQIEGDEFSANSNKFEFHVGSGSNYAKIDSSLNAIVLHTNINGDHTGIELNRINKSIDISANTINLESTSNAHIKANDFYIESIDNNRLLEINSTDNIIEIGKKIGNKYTDISINGLTLPHAQGQAGILQLVNGNELRWSKDIGVHHAEVTADKVYGVAHIDWPLDDGSPNEGWVETVIISISDNSNSEIFAIKIYYSGNGYTADIQRLSHFSNNNNDVKRHDIIIRNDNNTIYICVNALSTQLSWNGLAYSSNCTIHETADHAWPDNTKSNIYIVSPYLKREVIYDPSAGSIEWDRISHDSLIIPWPITKDPSTGKPNIEPNQAGFLKFARKANGEIGTLSWSPLDNQLKDIANNDAGTKVFIVGTERTGAAVSTCNEFYNNIRVYIDQYCNIFATAFYATSDERKKKDIKEIEFNDASILIPKEYRFKDSNKKAYGFIAQEVEKAGYTDIVNTDEETGDKTLDYNSAFAIALAQMQAKIKQLEDEIKELKELKNK